MTQEDKKFVFGLAAIKYAEPRLKDRWLKTLGMATISRAVASGFLKIDDQGYLLWTAKAETYYNAYVHGSGRRIA